MVRKSLLLLVFLLACDPAAPAGESQVGPGGDTAPGCGNIDYLGVCVGDEAIFCLDDRLARADCGALGCGWVNDESGYYCGGSGFRPADPGGDAPPARDDACDGLPPEGRCEGDLLVWCDRRVRGRDCAKEQGRCADVGGRFDCVPDAPDAGPAPPDAGVGEPLTQDAGEPPPPPPPPPDEPPPPDAPPPDAPPPADDRICYRETFHDGADLSAVRARYRQDPVGALRQALELRWPGGEPLTRTPQAFLGFLETGSWSAFFDSAATVMHESAHGFHADNGLWQQRTTCYIRGDLHIAVDIIPTPARSLIRARLPDDSTRLYAGTYLTGEQGQRGFFEILEELNCYVMDMTTYAVFGDELDILGVSGRDGAVSFFLFLQIYLGALRAEQPATWQQICDQPAVRQFIDVEWRAMHFWLAIADRYPALGIHDGEVRRHLYQADRMGELAACLGFALEAGPCRDRQPGE